MDNIRTGPPFGDPCTRPLLPLSLALQYKVPQFTQVLVFFLYLYAYGLSIRWSNMHTGTMNYNLIHKEC